MTIYTNKPISFRQVRCSATAKKVATIEGIQVYMGHDGQLFTKHTGSLVAVTVIFKG